VSPARVPTLVLQLGLYRDAKAAKSPLDLARGDREGSWTNPKLPRRTYTCEYAAIVSRGIGARRETALRVSSPTRNPTRCDSQPLHSP
jgi:hypothetical protein